MRQALPDTYRGIDESELIARITNKKNQLGDKIIILGHHYQIPQIVKLSDFRGDSFELSRKASQQRQARDIVFCGVHFMAESAAVLAQPHQRITIPDMDAGCPMADMANLEQVEDCWAVLTSVFPEEDIVPITYMNSSAAIKAFCGTHGGCVCTSSNSLKAFQKAFDNYDRLLFLPDEHLGRNTANTFGIPREQMVRWDPTLPDGGVSEDQLKQAKLILWKGYCHVHTYFRPKHIHQMRERYPDAHIIVHPECPETVTAFADEMGSTGKMVQTVKDAKPGATIVIGTEINLVIRLATENPDKTVVPLARSMCPNMYKISLNDLLWVLDNLGDVNIVTLSDHIIQPAKLALQRMLELQ